ncbi:reverse transcriptase domain-containing protein [Pseudomonas nitroreducens]|uniref:reverse transcriptase domain-containing protein n=1 Tax=Pseudomonas nitroreducens TaxID=46680 RepID=UPI00351CB8F2
MSIIKTEYQTLLPKGATLQDIVVLAQAWKKSHGFIRRHNSYADVLELDSSTINLERQLKEWSKSIGDPGFLPEDLKLVPAPKNKKWEFRSSAILTEDLLELTLLEIDSLFQEWIPCPDEDGKGSRASEAQPGLQMLRPLAHISIRDQSLATAVMMCLAESIETAQGNPDESDVLKARGRGLVSYGNRLHCRWSEYGDTQARAHFSWGNSQTYRKYFQDYRAFLSRPRQVCSEFSPCLSKGRELFVVNLDLKSFYDRVDRRALLRELQRLEAEYRQAFHFQAESGADSDFWDKTSRIMNWSWRSGDIAYAPLFNETESPELDLGLPQGLVASGFLANAYLIGFDRAVDRACKESREIDSEIKVVDYCRYVDDIRIVVEAPSYTHTPLLEPVKKFILEQLKEHCGRLGASKEIGLSEGKCSVTPYRSMSAQNNVSTLMSVLGAELSGTFDLESLTQAAGGLEGLLWMSDQIEGGQEPPTSRLRLATIAAPATDVRDDTVKRFVATRLAELMRQRLAMTDICAPDDTGESLGERITSGMALAHEFESTARKLIKCWAENPALVLLLRCGLDLFPHPRLLAPVLEALSSKLYDMNPGPLKPEHLREIRAIEYVAADLLRAGVVETGFRSVEDYPEVVDIQGYREELGAFARRIIIERDGSPWYLLQQAFLYLASVGDCGLAASSVTEPLLGAAYSGLRKAMLFEPMASKDLLEILPLALVAQQMHPNSRRFGVWLSEGLRATPDEAFLRQIVSTVALERPDLLLEALGKRGGRPPKWREFVPQSLVEINRINSSKHKVGGALPSRQLLRVMQDPLNVFGQENGLLMLAKALLSVPGIEKRLSAGLSPVDITLKCADWSSIQRLPIEAGFLEVSLTESEVLASPLYERPDWVTEEGAWLYGLGRILRSALTGEFDFTSRRFLMTEDVGRYKGIRSSWYKRRFGMLNSVSGLMDEPAPVSPWLSGFLSTLLQWPGIEFKANDAAPVASVRTPGELLALLEKRIAAQRALYGDRSRTPIYVLPTSDDAPLVDRPLRVAIVQTLRPKMTDFDIKDPTHWTPAMLSQHRRHLAEVCRLAHAKLRAWASARPLKEGEDETPAIDVILFPELAVHPEHVFFLRRLSDKLQANIFAGLTFMHSDKCGGPINQGVWLIRTDAPDHGRSIQYVWQGKLHPMKLEREMGIKGYRPHLTLVELPVGTTSPTRLAAAICYDATDLDLVADLRDRSDVFLVAALNQDVQTFDNMVAALHFHMYQPVVLANSGEFGGSTAQVPLPKHERLVAHNHGGDQVAVSVFELDPAPFKSSKPARTPKLLKAPPAGYKGRP